MILLFPNKKKKRYCPVLLYHFSRSVLNHWVLHNQALTNYTYIWIHSLYISFELWKNKTFHVASYTFLKGNFWISFFICCVNDLLYSFLWDVGLFTQKKLSRKGLRTQTRRRSGSFNRCLRIFIKPINLWFV